MDRYSFLVRILPPLLHAGLARRTEISIARFDPILAKKKRRLVTSPVSVEKLFLAKFTKIKLRQDAL